MKRLSEPMLASLTAHLDEYKPGDWAGWHRDHLFAMVAEIRALREIEKAASTWVRAHDKVMDYLFENRKVPFDDAKAESDAELDIRTALSKLPAKVETRIQELEGTLGQQKAATVRACRERDALHAEHCADLDRMLGMRLHAEKLGAYRDWLRSRLMLAEQVIAAARAIATPYIDDPYPNEPVQSVDVPTQHNAVIAALAAYDAATTTMEPEL